MKKSFLNTALITIAILTLASTTVVLATQQDQQEVIETAKQATIDYPLPYPGMLPDNKLFILKKARDRVMEFLIADPLKKAEFYLLLSDKRLAMAKTFVDYNKFDYAKDSLLRAENFYEKAESNLWKAKSANKNIDELKSRMLKAGDKHLEIQETFRKNNTEQFGATLETANMTITRAMGRIKDYDKNSSDN